MRYITNVGRIAQAVLPVSHSGLQQIVYYDDGVGADKKGLARMISGGFGIGLERNIYEAYRFLCFNYEKGDDVILYGFSRGAYTVRSLAGMIGKVGLVKSVELKQIPEALELYRNHDDEASATFKRTFARDGSITLMGCWDTVGALGYPIRRRGFPSMISGRVVMSFTIRISVFTLRGHCMPFRLMSSVRSSYRH